MAMPTLSADFLGTGWSFPPSFSANGKAVAMVSDEEDIVQSLHIILSTATGERAMLCNFGCDLNNFLYEEMDQSLVNNVTTMVQTALLNYEARIDVLGIGVSESQQTSGLLLITVNFQVRSTNSRYNMVFPFYLTEGSPI